MLCRGCGNESDNGICAQCEGQEWTNECKNCHLTCPLQYCVPCHVNFKLNRKCEKCDIASPTRWCTDCFKRFIHPCFLCQTACEKKYCETCFNTPEKCGGCGGFKRPGNLSCFKCTQYEWIDCAVCNSPTPLDTLCLKCSDNYCRNCLQPSKKTYCITCWNNRPSCVKCNTLIYPGFKTCKECK